MFQLSKKGSSNDSGYAKLAFNHHNATLGFLLLFPFLNTVVASTGWRLKSTLFTKQVAIQAVLALLVLVLGKW